MLNNKEKPIKQYEPFFTNTWEFKGDAEVNQQGVTPHLHYDAIGRLTRTDLPDGTQSRQEHRPWRSLQYDSADSLTAGGAGSDWYSDVFDLGLWGTPTPNSAVEGRLQTAWATARSGSLTHRDTPSVIHTDSLGRPVLEQQCLSAATTNKEYTDTTDVRITYGDRGHAVQVDAEYDPATGTRHTQLATFDLVDAAGRSWKHTARDAQIYGSEATTGHRYQLLAIDGQPVQMWDSKGHSFVHSYDGLRRPLSLQLDGTRVRHMLYGVEHGSPKTQNLLGQVWKSYDASGEQVVVGLDEDGNVVETQRRFTSAYRDQHDWEGLVDGGITPLPAFVLDPSNATDDEVFTQTTAFDALGRPKTETLNHGASADSTRTYSYDAGGQVVSISAAAAGQTADEGLRSVTYNARGQKLVVERGERSDAGHEGEVALSTSCVYDPQSFRLMRLRTVRATDGAILQDLFYVYDAVGNIVLRDDASQSTVYYNNAAVTPEQRFGYDALDRLVSATGREHESTFGAGPTGGSSGRPGGDRQQGVPYGRGPVAALGDGTALRRYTQEYLYDRVGNITTVYHRVGGSTVAERKYTFTASDGSAVLSATGGELFNNQVLRTGVGSDTFPLQHDAHGNIDAMPHLVGMSYDAFDRLHSVQSMARFVETDDGEPTAMDPTEKHDWFYVYDGGGPRVRKVRAVVGGGLTERREERFYVGGFEVWRRYSTPASDTAAGVPDVERETLHVAGAGMVETKTWDGGAVVASPLPRWRLSLDDHLGSVSVEVSLSGAVISYEEFHPYGTTAFQSFGASEVSRKRYRYTGMERDEETGMQYHTARYYLPWLGRWNRPDPAGLVDGVGTFSYGRGSPIGRLDRQGTDSSQEDEGSISRITPTHPLRSPKRKAAYDRAKLKLGQLVKSSTTELRSAINRYSETPLPDGDQLSKVQIADLTAIGNKLDTVDLVLEPMSQEAFEKSNTWCYQQDDNSIHVPYNRATGEFKFTRKVLFHEVDHVVRYGDLTEDLALGNAADDGAARLKAVALEEIHAEFYGILGDELILLDKIMESGGRGTAKVEGREVEPRFKSLGKWSPPVGDPVRRPGVETRGVLLERIGAAVSDSLLGSADPVWGPGEDSHPAYRKLFKAMGSSPKRWRSFLGDEYSPILKELRREKKIKRGAGRQ